MILARTNRVYRSLHRPLTYMGIERKLFFLVCVAGVAMWNMFSSLLAALIVAAGGLTFGYWATNTDPAFLKILGRAQRFKTRYDAAKLEVPDVEIR